jgi:hypothetical protein
LGLGLRENKKIVVRMNESARQTHVFVVRLGKMHGKLVCLPCASEKHTAKFFLKKPIFHLFEMWRRGKVLCRASWRKCTANKIFVMHFFRVHDKELICRAFFLCSAPYKKRTAKTLCRALEKNAWQKF